MIIKGRNISQNNSVHYDFLPSYLFLWLVWFLVFVFWVFGFFMTCFTLKRNKIQEVVDALVHGYWSQDFTLSFLVLMHSSSSAVKENEEIRGKREHFSAPYPSRSTAVLSTKKQ